MRTRLHCRYCAYKTTHECLSSVQSVGGLLWRCTLCLRSTVFTAYQASLGQSE